MQKLPRRLALLVAVAGIFLLGGSLWYWYAQEQRVALDGNWLPLLLGLSGVPLAAFGTCAFHFFGNPHSGMRRREKLRIIAARTGWTQVLVLLLLIDYGGIAASFCGTVMLFATAAQGGIAPFLWVMGAACAYALHRGAEKLTERVEARPSMQD